VRPGDAAGAPSTSNLNVFPGDIVPNQVTVAIPTSGVNIGKIDITYGSAPGNKVDIIVDVVGYTTNTGLLDLVNRVTALETASPARVVWVADDNTGDYALLSTALAAITDATSSNPYVIKIAPGIYTETASVVLKDYVDVEGSGQDITTINCACAKASNTALSATVSATAITAEIRHLTINNTGGGNNYSTGVWTEDVADGSFSMLHVTATASGGGSSYYGVSNISSSPSMNNVTATATGGTNVNYGVSNYNSSPSMTNVTATATGGTNNFGVYNNVSSSPTMNNVTATATGGTYNYGVVNSSSSPSMNNVTATATGGTNLNLGVYNFSSSSPTIRNSSITGTTNSIFNDSSLVKVADTALGGPTVAGGGFTCVGVYTTAFVALEADCAPSIPT
jgi:hypothetical protein